MAERMVRQIETVEEIWETTGSHEIWVKQTLADGTVRPMSVGGRPGMKLRISQYDRLRNQEIVQEFSADPFTNGMLIRTDADQNEDEMTRSPNALSAEALAEIFTSTGQAFTDRVNQLNEYNVRRMLEASVELDATNSQITTLQQMIATKWPIGGDTPTYRELKGYGEVAHQS